MDEKQTATEQQITNTSKNTNSRGSRLAKNTAVLTVGRLSSKVLVFLLVRFYTYILTDAEYSTADLITNLSMLLIPLACAGLSTGFFRFAADAGTFEEQVSVFSSGACILSGATAAFLILAPLLLLSPYFSSYVWLIILYVLSANLHYFCSEFIRARGQYRLFAVQGLLNTSLNIALNFLFLLPLSMGVIGYVLSVLVADALTSLFIIFYCKLWRYLRPGAADPARIKAMLRFCLAMIPAGICWWITGVSDRYMVSYFCGDAVNGLYTAAYKIPNLLTICAGIFMDAWQFSAVLENRKPTVGEDAEAARVRRASVADFFTKIFRGYAAFILLAAGGMILFSRVLAWILFDVSFSDAWQYIPVLLVSTACYSLCTFAGSAYIVEKRGIPSLLTSLLGAVANIILNLCLIPRTGAMGAAFATLLSYFLVLVARLWSSRRYVRYHVPIPWLAANLTLLSALAAVMTLAPPYWLIICIVLFAAVALLDAPPLLSNLRLWLRRRRKES